MDKHRFISLLPNVLQTETLKKTFATTVDPLFQPGRAEQISGYIGQHPSYTDPSKDFYLAEPTVLRQQRQLDPTMVSRDQTGTYNKVQFYGDYVNYLRSRNGVVGDHNRLFSDTSYSWAPPIDPDKLINFGQYTWFGGDPSVLPTLVLTAPFTQIVTDGVASAFDIPAAIAGVDSSRETLMVFVDGALVEAEVVNGKAQPVYIPGHATTVTVYRYGDLKTLIQGNSTFDVSELNNSGVVALSSGMKVFLADGNWKFSGWDVLPFDYYNATGDQIGWDLVDRAPTYWVEGVGSDIEFVIFETVSDLTSTAALYSTIDRRSRDGNPWSRANFWVHKDTYAWSGISFAAYAAKRPIIEFIPNIELFGYGRNRVVDVDCLVSVDPKYFNGTQLTSIALVNATGKPFGSVYVDAGYVLKPGDRILVLDQNAGELSNCILNVNPAIDGLTLVTEVELIPNQGDITRLSPRGNIPYDSLAYDESGWDYDYSTVEYVFDGTTWNEVAIRGPYLNPTGIDFGNTFVTGDPLGRLPRFNQYTAEKTAYSAIQASPVIGNDLFRYASGTGSNDKYIGYPLTYDQSGQVEFENTNVVTRVKKTDGTTITGLQFYRILSADSSADVFECGWKNSGIYSVQSLINNTFEVPANLQANPDNAEVTYVSRGQFFDHMTKMISEQDGFVGSAYKQNNWRNTARDRSRGQSILQQRSPLLKAMLLASDSRFDQFDAIRFVEQEYVRFRNKFAANVLEVLRNGTRLVTDSTDLWLDTVLANLQIAKTTEFPFASSQMIPGYYIPATAASMGLMPVSLPQMETDLSYSQAVEMIRGHDGSRTVAFGDIRDSVLLALELRIWANIPAQFKTEALPAFDQFNTVDGFWRPASGSVSADSACARSIPLTSDASDQSTVVPRTAESMRYNRSEIVQTYTSWFMRWAQSNALDYRVNEGFVASDPFTWNFRGCLDQQGNTLPGNWRAIYRWYFDTDQPNVTPWEMLGFSNKPSWWDSEYGVAPYTSGNLNLWNDLAQGRIAAGVRAGVDVRFARPGLLDVLPIDDQGNLLDPVAARIVATPPSQLVATRKWAVGDHGPVENLWINSASWPFVRAAVAGLTRPAEWLELGWDTDHVLALDDGQLINSFYQSRPTSSVIHIHGETLNGVKLVVRGIQQWLSDYMVSNSQQPSILGASIRGLECHLAYKMAGFTQSNNLRVFADNFGILPSEDVSVLLYESPPVREATYSGVIVEWTGQGWRIVGYDGSKEEFCVMPGDQAGPKTTISLGVDPVVYEWRANVYYPTGRIVEHNLTYYVCVTSHTSRKVFEDEFWNIDTNVSNQRSPKATVAVRATGEITSVPYDTLYTSYNDVAEFLRSYGRWLEACGWIFSAIDSVTSEVQNWDQAILEFLKWSQTRWKAGNFIALSPGASSISFNTSQGTVYSMTETVNGSYGLLDRTGRPISKRNSFISRLDTTTVVETNSDDLFAARARVGEIEHVVVFSNTTIFNDVVYQPLFNLRQPRLKLLGMRSSEWTGRLDAPGYVINNNALVPNFAKAAEDIREMFDIEKSDSKELRDYARHVVGYQTRDYLDNLLLSETSQFEFYQGMIQQKGAPGVFEKLSRSLFVDSNKDISFLDEWGIHAGRYGATNKLKTLSFQLIAGDIRNTPQLVTFNGYQPNNSVMALTASDTRWVRRVAGTVFPSYAVPTIGLAEKSQKKFLPTAGYVRTTEADFTSFRTADLVDLYATVGSQITRGSRIWIYRRPDQTWDMQRVFGIGSDTNSIRLIETANEDATLFNTMRITFNEPHLLTQYDVGGQLLVDGTIKTAPALSGFYTLASIDSSTAIRIPVTGLKGIDAEENGGLGVPMYILRSMRFADRTALTAYSSRHAPVLGQIVYLDNAVPGAVGGAVRWAVYTWDGTTWQVLRAQPLKIDSSKLQNVSVYDSLTKYSSDELSFQPVLLDNLTVLDPVAGLISGAAEKEITYKIEYDPARYTNTLNDQWGAEQVGILWWDLSTTCYLECETDVIDSLDDARTKSEIDYRVANWARLAAGSSVDIYEWTRSTLIPNSPLSTFVLAPTGSWITVSEFDIDTSTIVTAYYFWAKNVTTVPYHADRTLSAQQVSALLADPYAEDLPWISAISPNGLLVNGLVQYLNDTSSVLKFDVLRQINDGVVHNEWQLTRKGDDASLPTTSIWRNITQSLVGFDDFTRLVPDPSLARQDQVGTAVHPRQSLFQNEGTARDAAFAARQSFVDMTNLILARRNITAIIPGIADALNSSTPVYSSLLWTLADGASQIEPPPYGAWDYTANTLEERDAIADRLYAQYVAGTLRVTQYNSPRILLRNYQPLFSNFNGFVPSWSVWQFDVTDLPLNPVANDYLALSTNYDVAVPTHAALTTLIASSPPPVGARILVEQDETADGFWTVWVYRPLTDGSTNGLVFVTSQTYRTSDFWSIADWYSPGYTVDQVPAVSYSTVAVRDAVEGTTAPLNTVVRVLNDGQGSWIWTSFVDGKWTLVARQNGTVQLSTALYDATRLPFGVTSTAIADIANRDGSWELRELIHSLRTYVLSDLEVNELFFSLIHFAHTQQNQVEWAFKTSFLVVKDLNERLTQTPILNYDTTDNLLSYINEVKPYRVKTRDYSRILTPDIDVAAIISTDFDKPVYFDETRYRTLSVDSDATVLATRPWVYWYDNYLNSSFDPASTNYNPVRRLATTMRFDRVDPTETLLTPAVGWDTFYYDMVGWDTVTVDDAVVSSALSRRIAFYNPSNQMFASDSPELMGIQFKGVAIDGGSMFVPTLPNPTDWDIARYDTLPYETLLITDRDDDVDGDDASGEDILMNPDGQGTSLAMRDPLHDAGHPEEFVPTHGNENLTICVDSAWVTGAPNHYSTYIRTTRVRTANIKLTYPEVAQSANAILVYRDGLRLLQGTDYTVDYFARVITVKVGTPKAKIIAVHVIGAAGLTKLSEQSFFDMNTTGHFTLRNDPVVVLGWDDQNYDVVGWDQIDQTAQAQVEVIVDGTVQSGFYGVNGRTVSLDVLPPLRTSVAVNVYNAPNNRVSVATRVNEERFSLADPQPFTLSHPTNLTGPAAVMEYIGTMVEIDGVRLSPPFTRYGTLNYAKNKKTLLIKPVTDVANIRVWFDGVLFTGDIAHGSTLDVALQGVGWDETTYDSGGWDLHYPLAIVDNELVLTTPALGGNRVIVSIREDHDYDCERIYYNTVTQSYYDEVDTGWDTTGWDLPDPSLTVMSTSQLNIVKDYGTPPDPTKVARTTTFDNPDLMGIETHSFQGVSNGTYYIASHIKDENHLHVTMNGLYLIPTLNYTISPIDSSSVNLVISGSQSQTDEIVVWAFTGDSARLPETWAAMSVQPSMSMMGDLVVVEEVFGWDLTGWDSAGWDLSAASVVATSGWDLSAWDEAGWDQSTIDTNDGLTGATAYNLKNSWDFVEWSFERTGVLQTDLLAADSTITVRLNPYGVAGELVPIKPLPQPQSDIPGIIWINGERIEYFDLSQSNGLATISQIRRATRGSRLGTEQRISQIFDGDGSSTVFTLANAVLNTTLEVSVQTDNQIQGLGSNNFTAVQINGGVQVTLAQPLTEGVRLILAQTSGTLHAAGTYVHSASPITFAKSPFHVQTEGTISYGLET